ncbi:hypothetical protein DL765_008694 [Monosporascus sp. GIB2]|nr:hypothetical protein DL765_008694 [Monosporascus sp. GIB2]
MQAHGHDGRQARRVPRSRDKTLETVFRTTGIFTKDEHFDDASPVAPTGACKEAVRRDADAASGNAAAVQAKGRRAATTGFLKHIANPWALLEDYD